jgi:hypothetical protein
MTPSELAQLRADTPGVGNRIHVNNCGAALMPRVVVEAVHGHGQIELEASVGGGRRPEGTQFGLAHGLTLRQKLPKDWNMQKVLECELC